MSIGTVDRVLHNRGEVSEVTRKRVLKIISELKYKPNIIASTLASKRKIRFITLLPEASSPDAYWSKPLHGIERIANEIQQYGITVENYTFNLNDPKSFSQQAEQILGTSPDGVVLAPSFYREAFTLTNHLKRAGIPFVFIDSEIKNSGQLSYVGQDSFQSGYLAGKILGLMTGCSEALLIVHFAKETDNQNHLILREKGFLEWFQKHQPNRNVKALEFNPAEEKDWEGNFLKNLTTNGISGIYVTNSKSFQVAALLEKFKIENIRLIGHDLIESNRDFLKRDTINFLICQRPEEQGYKAINKLFQHITLKNEVGQINYTSIDIITKENLDFYKEFN